MMSAVIARYDAVADSYASSSDSFEGSAVRALLDLVGSQPGPRALDLACGHGPIARELARRGAQVTGIDVSQELLDRAGSWPVEPDVMPIRYVHGNAADRSALEGEMFDIIVSNFGLSDIDDLNGLCQTVAGVLADDGRFIFSILHPCFAGAVGVSGSWPTGRSYYDEGFWRADGELSVLRQRVGANHRMLSSYVNALVRNDLVIDTILEPPPESDWAVGRPGASAQPVYLVIQCVHTSSP